MLLTDPPYNVNVSNSKGMTIANDNMGKDEFAAFLNSAMSNAVYALKPGGAFYSGIRTARRLHSGLRWRRQAEQSSRR